MEEKGLEDLPGLLELLASFSQDPGRKAPL